MRTSLQALGGACFLHLGWAQQHSQPPYGLGSFIHEVCRCGGRGHAQLEWAVLSLLSLLQIRPAAAARLMAGSLVNKHQVTVDGLMQRAETCPDLHILRIPIKPK